MQMRQLAAKLSRRIPHPPQKNLSSSTRAITANGLPYSIPGQATFSQEYGSSRWKTNGWNLHPWTLMAGQAAIIFGINANHVLADPGVENSSGNDLEGGGLVGLRKIEDGSIVSNEHTLKWRIFTDNGREYFLKGKMDQAEKFFVSAVSEAKEGFGETDPHVASACNNLAELYRVKKEFDKAEPLYLEAINILEKSFGPEDIRVGTAVHNLGQFYLMRRKLEEARKCYERALKIKRRVLGLTHVDYADTMYHLGTVLHLLGKDKDAEAFILESIRILEGNGEGESLTCIRRLRYLGQMYLRSNRPSEAENIQRKILHIMELSKGWNSMDTVIAAEALALTLQAVGNLKEAEELLERCLEVRKAILPENHIQIAGNMLHSARVKMLKSNQLRKMNISDAIAELNKAAVLLNNSTRVALQVLNKIKLQVNKNQKNGAFFGIGREGNGAFVILLQSLDARALLEITKQELELSGKDSSYNAEAENALRQCINAYKEFEAERLISDSTEVKSLYLKCLKQLLTLIGDGPAKGEASLQEVNDEIRRVETEISRRKKHKV